MGDRGMDAGEKACSKCGVVKGLGEFYKNCNSKDGHKSRCGLCELGHEPRPRSEVVVIDGVQQRNCLGCGKVKPIGRFQRSLSHRDGYLSKCKVCSAKARRSYRRQRRSELKSEPKAVGGFSDSVLADLVRSYSKKNDGLVIRPVNHGEIKGTWVVHKTRMGPSWYGGKKVNTYWMLSDDDDIRCVKIGVSKNPLARMGEFNLPFGLVLIGVICGDCEGWLHEKFDDYRLSGEWFSFEDAVCEFSNEWFWHQKPVIDCSGDFRGLFDSKPVPVPDRKFDILARSSQEITTEASRRFLNKISASGGWGGDQCWKWTGTKNPEKGVGIFSNGRSRTWRAHRFAYAMWNNGELPQAVVHTCGNQDCVNPMHLRAARHGEIIGGRTYDMSDKRTTRDAAIRTLYASGEFDEIQLASIFHLAKEGVVNVLNGTDALNSGAV